MDYKDVWDAVGELSLFDDYPRMPFGDRVLVANMCKKRRDKRHLVAGDPH